MTQENTNAELAKFRGCIKDVLIDVKDNAKEFSKTEFCKLIQQHFDTSKLHTLVDVVKVIGDPDVSVSLRTTFAAQELVRCQEHAGKGVIGSPEEQEILTEYYADVFSTCGLDISAVGVDKPTDKDAEL